MKKILEICVVLDGGGIDRYLFNYCVNSSDFLYDFCVVDIGKKGILEDEIENRGSHIYRVPTQSSNPVANYKALQRIMMSNHYDAVHVHLGYRGLIALFCAKKCGIKTRIVHAHIASEPEGKIKHILRKIMTYLIMHYATDLAGCGIDAAKWVWGEKAFSSGRVTIHNNAIDTQCYAFNEATREIYRRKLGIEGKMVVGHVGRLSLQKNQIRLVDIFKKIHDTNPDSVLLLIGCGEKECELKEKVRNLKIEKNVKFLGIRNDVPDLLNAMDVFVFPSLYEGLPFTLIETQCNGLHALCSDSVSAYTKISDCVEFISLDEDDSIWADKSVSLAKLCHNIHAKEMVVGAGYDLMTERKNLEKYYNQVIHKNTRGKEIMQ